MYYWLGRLRARVRRCLCCSGGGGNVAGGGGGVATGVVFYTNCARRACRVWMAYEDTWGGWCAGGGGGLGAILAALWCWRGGCLDVRCYVWGGWALNAGPWKKGPAWGDCVVA
jgi:hypothetical protein